MNGLLDIFITPYCHHTMPRPLIGCTVLLLLAMPVSLATAQETMDELRRVRADKIERILLIQDLRTPHDAFLLAALSDPDPVVQARATLACGSVQDTTLIGLVTRNLTDGPPEVQELAAFALGQLGRQLSPAGQMRLEHDLLWNRLEYTLARNRLIEEIGKFGTSEGLADLMAKVGNVYPLRDTGGMVRSIARFAMRGITSADATLYLLRFIRPADAAPPDVAYALQRIGNSRPIRENLGEITNLWRHPDPIVRMHIATLLGQFPDVTSSIGPLSTLARFDADWRVRVNALKALARFSVGSRPDVLDIFREKLFDGNHHVATTALTAVAGVKVAQTDSLPAVKELIGQVRIIAENEARNFPWFMQGEAATSYARLTGRPAVKPTPGISPSLQAMLIAAFAVAEGPAAAGDLAEFSFGDDPQSVVASLSALQELCRSYPDDTTLRRVTYTTLLNSLESTDVAVLATAASALADSFFLAAGSVIPLVQCLERCTASDDLEAILEICGTLGALGDRRASPSLMRLLNSGDIPVAQAAARAVDKINNLPPNSTAVAYREPLYVDFDFQYLRMLPDTVRAIVETVRGDIVLDLYTQIAPFTVMNVVKLSTRRGFYNGISFHRVVPNFVIQGGDPRGDGWGGPGYTIRSEFSPLTYDEGVVGIASAGKDTEGSQFFITHSPQPHLDGRYTIIGRVVSGLDVVTAIEPGDRMTGLKIETTLGR